MYEKFLNEVNDVAGKMMKKFHGYSNGYVTWIKGSVQENTTGGLEISVPNDNKTRRQLQDYARKIEEKIKPLLKKYNVQLVSFRYHHAEHGAFTTVISIEETQELKIPI